MRFIKDDGFEDKTLRNKFIAWYHEIFRQDQSAFYSPENLETSEKKVLSGLEQLRDSKEELVEAKPIERIDMSESLAFSKIDPDQTTDGAKGRRVS